LERGQVSFAQGRESVGRGFQIIEHGHALDAENLGKGVGVHFPAKVTEGDYPGNIGAGNSEAGGQNRRIKRDCREEELHHFLEGMVLFATKFLKMEPLDFGVGVFALFAENADPEIGPAKIPSQDEW